MILAKLFYPYCQSTINPILNYKLAVLTLSYTWLALITNFFITEILFSTRKQLLLQHYLLGSPQLRCCWSWLQGRLPWIRIRKERRWGRTRIRKPRILIRTSVPTTRWETVPEGSSPDPKTNPKTGLCPSWGQGPLWGLRNLICSEATVQHRLWIPLSLILMYLTFTWYLK